MFDPVKYFGGLKIKDLDDAPEDPRYREMFESPKVVETQHNPSPRRKNDYCQKLVSQNTKKIVQKYYSK